MRKAAIIATIIASIIFLYTTNIFLNDPIAGSKKDGIHVFNFFMWFTIPIILWVITYFSAPKTKSLEKSDNFDNLKNESHLSHLEFNNSSNIDKKESSNLNYMLLALISGALSGFGCYLYASVYQELTVIDYSGFIPPSAMFISCFMGCILASAGHALFVKLLPKIGDIIFGFLFAIITFASILGVFKSTLPDNDDESFFYLIYGFAIPMHFFPIVVWNTIKPIFIRK